MESVMVLDSVVGNNDSISRFIDSWGWVDYVWNRLKMIEPGWAAIIGGKWKCLDTKRWRRQKSMGGPQQREKRPDRSGRKRIGEMELKAQCVCVCVCVCGGGDREKEMK